MRGRKKWLALLLAVVMCLGAVYSDAFVWQTEAATGTGKTIEASEIDSYGSQLTAEQKAVYDALVDYYIGEDGFAVQKEADFVYVVNGELIYNTEGEVKNRASELALDAAFAFQRDYPQMFWTSGVQIGYSRFSSTDSESVTKYGLYSVTVKLATSDPVTSEELATYKAGVNAAVEAICKKVPDGSSVYQYYRAIHDWICEKASYHYDAASKPPAYPQAFTSQPLFDDNEIDNKVVCEGYGEAYEILCDQLRIQKGIPLKSMMVTGKGYGGSTPENHLWNYVQMSDGKWYAVDATWDDDNENPILYTYFLCGTDSPCLNGKLFKEDHAADGNISSGVSFSYPELSTYGYRGHYEESGLTWDYADGKLTISGTGEMPDFDAADRVPWYEYRDAITSIEVKDGITRLAKGVFAGYRAVTELKLPFVGLSRDAEGEEALLGILFGGDSGGVFQPFGKVEAGAGYSLQGYRYAIPSSLVKVSISDATKISFGALYGCSSLKEVVFNEEITSIGENVLTGCTSLESLTIPFVGATAERNQSWDAVLGYLFGYGSETDVKQCYASDGMYISLMYYQIPSSLQEVRVLSDTEISFGAFSGCTSLKRVIFDFEIASVDEYAFYQSTGLESVEFRGDVPVIASNAFYGCNAIIGYYPSGNATWTESVRQNYGATSIDWRSKTNPVDQLMDINGVRLSLHDKIGLKFLVEQKGSVSEDDYMLIAVEGETAYKIFVKEASKETSNLTGTEKYVFECDLNSKQMGKSVIVQMVVSGEKGNPVAYSVKKYADTILEMPEGRYENAKAMVRAMLNYGGYAQRYFDKTTSGLVNEGLYSDEADPVLTETIDLDQYSAAISSESETKGLHLSTATLVLDSETELRFYFELDDGRTLNDYRFEIAETGKQLETGYNSINEKYYVAVKKVKATELKNMYHISISEKASGSRIASIEYGALSYVKSVLGDSAADKDLQNLTKALYLYGKAALTYNSSGE